ncbi:hypothetical protein Pelo_19223 [Pelomyxa schiedti]|nr:hypothetical protein Pelo_19223 [Pelomyxa schiedti]
MFSTRRTTGKAIITEPLKQYIPLKKCALPWDDCSIPQLDLWKVATSKAWESLEDLESQVGRDHKGEQVSFLDKVMAAGLLDGIVCYAVYDDAVRDESQVLPLIERGTYFLKKLEDQEKGNS